MSIGPRPWSPAWNNRQIRGFSILGAQQKVKHGCTAMHRDPGSLSSPSGPKYLVMLGQVFGDESKIMSNITVCLDDINIFLWWYQYITVYFLGCHRFKASKEMQSIEASLTFPKCWSMAYANQHKEDGGTPSWSIDGGLSILSHQGNTIKYWSSTFKIFGTKNKWPAIWWVPPRAVILEQFTSKHRYSQSQLK